MSSTNNSSVSRSKFSVGDKVKLITTRYGDSASNPIWGGTQGRIEGVVYEIKSYDEIPVMVEWGERLTNCYYISDLEKIPSPSDVLEATLNSSGVEGKVKCCECEALFPTEEIFNHNAQFYCADCEGENFFVCSHCEAWCSNDEVLNCGDETFCSERCANAENWYTCRDCDTWVNSDANPYGYNTDCHIVCERCAESYGQCVNCNINFHNDALILDDEEEEYYCERCYRRFKGVIKDYFYKPHEFVYDKMPWENTVYLGIELEVECRDENPPNKAREVMAWLKAHKVEDRVYIKEDGSLDNGFEIVFHPITLQAIHKRFPMRAFLRALKRMGLSSSEGGTCGLHVHLSSKNMTKRDKWAGKLFFFKAASWIKKFSARADFNFCKFDSSMPLNGTSQDHGRYSAFNTAASPETVEIRVFNGCLEEKRFLASLQFSDLFAEYIQNTSVVFLKKASGALVWQSFLAYGKSKRRYGQFLKYCKGKGIV